MTQWYVKELSKATQVSVQTLHHYDKIGLLKPSIRLSNGYRVYSEKDLLRLQQIIALKFFGFKLSQIKTLLTAEVNMIAQFSAQSQFLQEKAKAFLEASEALQAAISKSNIDKSIPWETIIQLIEVYHMTQQLEKSWAGKVLNPKELKEYASFEQGLKTRFTENEKIAFEKQWDNFISEIESNLDKSPSSNFGIAMGKRCMEMINNLYGKQHASLRTTIWEKGYKTGQMDEEHALAPEIVAWMDNSISAYFKSRIDEILGKIGSLSSETLSTLWEGVLEEICGNDSPRKQAVIEGLLSDKALKPSIKEWLRNNSKI